MFENVWRVACVWNIIELASQQFDNVNVMDAIFSILQEVPEQQRDDSYCNVEYMEEPQY